jgi:hypothetical protein
VAHVRRCFDTGRAENQSEVGGRWERMIRRSSDGRREKGDGWRCGRETTSGGLRLDSRRLTGRLGRLAVSCSLVTWVYHKVEAKVFIVLYVMSGWDVRGIAESSR